MFEYTINLMTGVWQIFWRLWRNIKVFLPLQKNGQIKNKVIINHKENKDYTRKEN